MARPTFTVFCGGNGCMFLRSGLAKRQAEREATGHRCLNPDAHIHEDRPTAPATVPPTMRTDLERSTFQNRPAYRYLRASDQLPTLAASRETRDPLARVKLFNPTGTGTWYLAAYDADTRTAYGLADVHEAELGDIDLAELVAFRGRFGLPIERDLSWTPRPLSQCLEGA